MNRKIVIIIILTCYWIGSGIQNINGHQNIGFSTSTILVLVNENIYDSISENLSIFKHDLQNESYQVQIKLITDDSSPTEIKDLINNAIDKMEIYTSYWKLKDLSEKLKFKYRLLDRWSNLNYNREFKEYLCKEIYFFEICFLMLKEIYNPK